VEVLVAGGNEIWIQAGAGAGARFSDERYAAAGARIVDVPDTIWATVDLLLKVKEPQPAEFDYLRRGLTLFGYLHLGSNRALTERLMERQVTGIAFERVEQDHGYKPILEPMLELAGFMGMLFAFTHSSSTAGGRGKLAGQVAGIGPSRVRILGANVMSLQAARVAHSLGADVVLLDPDVQRLQRARLDIPGLPTLVSHAHVVAQAVAEADIVVNTYPWKPGQPGHLVTREHVRSMKERALLLDLASDDPGAVETSHPTSFGQPTYVEEGVIHLCVPNWPSSVARSAAHALSNALLPFIHDIADLGPRGALRSNAALRRGLMVIEGQVTDEAMAEWLGVPRARSSMVLGL
jgi:alanine dehydrogenase